MGLGYETGHQAGLEPVREHGAFGAGPGAEAGVSGAAPVSDAALCVHPPMAVPEAGVGPQQRKLRYVGLGGAGCWV